MKRISIRKTTPISTLVVMSMMVASLIGCAGGGKDTPKEEVELDATNVAFNVEGRYVTTISSDKVKLKDLSTENVKVNYEGEVDEEKILSKLAEAYYNKDKTEPSNSNEEPKVDYNLLYNESAVVESVVKNEDDTYSVTFIDEKSSEDTGKYFLTIPGENAYAFVDIEYPQMSLTSDLDTVYAGSEHFRVALTINGGEFNENLSDEDLFRTNAFEQVGLEVISKSARNVTLDVTGEIVKSDGGAYQWGVIGVNASGIKNGYTDIGAKIDVVLDYAGFDASTLQYVGGKVTGNLKIYGVADVNSLSKDKIIIDGATIEDLIKVDDTTVRLTMSVIGAESINDFVDAISGKEMTIDTYKTAVELSQATFYPVFDKIEESGDNFDITIKLYIYSGTIDDAINKDSVVLSGFFADGSVKSITKENDNLATLVISTPRGEMNEDNYSFVGGVTLLAGALTNAWGNKTTKEYSYSRNYSAESLGRASIGLGKDVLLEVQKYTRGLNTTFGKICYYGGIIGQVASIGKTILEATGVIQTDHAEEMAKLKEMDQKLDNIQTGINEIKTDLSKIISMAKEAKVRDKKREVDEFETLLIDFNNALNDVTTIQQQAAFDLALEDAVNRGNLDELPSFYGKTSANVAKEKEELRKQYLPSVATMSDHEAAEYNGRVISYLNEKSQDVNYPDYYSYHRKFEKLEELFGRICGMLGKPKSSNPITLYDELCALTYNFDSQTYEFRLSTRVALEYQLTKAMWAFALHYKVSSSDSGLYNNRANEYGVALNALKNNPATGHSASDIKASLRFDYKDKTTTETYIGDLAVAGSRNKDKAKASLRDKGYTIIDKNLNSGTGGMYIYLGYKTTTDYAKAVKQLQIKASMEPMWYMQYGYDAVPMTDTSDKEFLDSYGDLNCGCGDGKVQVYLWYSKAAAKNENPITSISFVNSKASGEHNIYYEYDHLNYHLNYGVGGEKIYISVNRAKANKIDYYSSVIAEADPEYHPYCYIIGCKTAAYLPGDGESSNMNNFFYSYTEKVAFMKDYLQKYHRSWSDDQRQDFLTRMRHSNFYEELESAGYYLEYSMAGDHLKSYEVKPRLGFTWTHDNDKYYTWVLNLNNTFENFTDFYRGKYVWFLLCLS